MAGNGGVSRATCLAVLLAAAAGPVPARSDPASGQAAQGRPLLIPQVEGERQGKLVGRAIACGAERTRIDAVLRAGRQKVLASVGAPFTEERYLPALRHAIDFETSLGRPSDEACARALDAFEQFEKAP